MTRPGDWLGTVVVSLAGPVTDWMIEPDDLDLSEYLDQEQEIEPGDAGTDFGDAWEAASLLCDFDLADERHWDERCLAWNWLAARTSRLVTEWWSQIGAVAEEVFDHGTVDGDRIATICAAMVDG